MIDWFIPGYRAGGPIQSCVNVAFALKDRYNILVYTTDTDFGVTEPYPEIISNQWINNLDPDIYTFYARTKNLTLSQIKKILLETDAEFIYLNHLFSPRFVIYPLWLKWRGFLKSKVVICPRGALYESALSVKRYKKIPFLKLFKWMGIHKMVRFHATSEREKKAILNYFPGSEILFADDFPNIRQPAFKIIPKQTGILKCIFIARIHPIKNLLFLLSLLNSVKSKIVFTIIGPVEDEAYWEKCKAIITNLPLNINVSYKGALPNHELLLILQDHHLFILPTVGENFGHSIFESFSAGRPVLISDQTPWLELEKENAGWALPLNNANAFTEKIELAAGWDQNSFDEFSKGAWQYAHNFIKNKLKIEQYVQLFT